LDYSFDVLISRTSNLGLCNWSATFTLFTALLPAPVCLCLRHGFQYMLLIRIYHYTCLCLRHGFQYMLLIKIYHYTCICLRHGFQYILLTRIYHYTCAYLCTPLGTHLATRWEVLTSLNLHVQILEFGSWWTSW